MNFLPVPILNAYTLSDSATRSKGLYLSYQVVFVLNFMICYFIMKVISSFMTPEWKRNNRIFFSSPYLSQRTLAYEGVDSFGSLLSTFVISALILGALVVTARTLFTPLSYFEIMLLAPSVYFATEATGALGQILFYPRYKRSFPIHFQPLLSPSLGQFWGRHWNLWVQDWLKDVSAPFRGRKTRRLVFIFFVSGIFHEIMVNLPYWLVYRKAYFGTMIAYFTLQAIGLKIEKTYLRGGNKILRRLFMFLVVFLPSPLFVNVPVLTFLGFIDG